MPVPERLPSYSELPVKAGAPPRSAWGLFGDDDQVGCVNLMTPAKAVEAARLVRTGRSFALNWEFELPMPAMFRRGNLRHTITGQGFGWPFPPITISTSPFPFMSASPMRSTETQGCRSARAVMLPIRWPSVEPGC